MKKLIFASLIGITTLANTSKTLVCDNQFEVDFGHLSVKLVTTIKKKSENHFVASSSTLDFYMGEDDTNWAWYEFYGDSSTPVRNVENYRPRKYKGHIKFALDTGVFDSSQDNVWNQRFFGNLDLIVPIVDFENAKIGDSISAPLIMTHVADHWGSTRTLECKVATIITK